jgi:hypothetical protein
MERVQQIDKLAVTPTGNRQDKFQGFSTRQANFSKGLKSSTVNHASVGIY